MHEIVLAPLARGDVERLVADALCCGPERARPLAELVYEKTGGNPFFVIQFLAAVDEEKLLHFDSGARMWIADIERIRGKGYTDNVVDLVVRKLARLGPSTRQVLERLACLGNVAKIATLAFVEEQPAETIIAALSEAVQAGLLLRSEDAFTFPHDRIHEAAYSLIPEAARAETHLRIGLALASKMSPAEIEEQIFDVVNQLNRAVALLQSCEQRERVAELNLVAGRRAKNATAYASAVRYLAAGRDLLPEDCWEHRYELVFALEVARAECELLTGNTDAEARLVMLAGRARTLTDLAAVASLREVLYTALNRFDRSIDVALGYLRKVGVPWPVHSTDAEVVAEYEAMLKRLQHRSIPDMAALPLMSDSTATAIVEVLTEMVPAAYFTDINLCCLVVCRIANLSFEHGNSNGSVYAYSLLGFLLRTRFGNHAGGGDDAMTTLGRILIVEDDPNDVELTMTALADYNLANEVVITRDGQQALDYLYCRGEFSGRPDENPAVMLLDLKLPKIGGLEILQQVKSDERLKMIPVVVLTSSHEEKDMMRSYSLGVNAYVVKPVDFHEFVNAVKELGVFWAVINEPPPGSVKK